MYLWVITSGILLGAFSASAGLFSKCIEELIILTSPGYMRYSQRLAVGSTVWLAQLLHNSSYINSDDTSKGLEFWMPSEGKLSC